MAGPDRLTESRGGGDRSRTDAFRFAPGNAVLAFAAIGALGAFALIAAAFDLGGARTSGNAIWLVPAGLFLIAVMIGLFWAARRSPVLLSVGPQGLNLPAAFARPIAWADIWRIRLTIRRVFLQPDFLMLRVDLSPGVRPGYLRRLWTMPAVDGWIAQKYGLRIPIHNLDATADVVLASIERFKPVQRLAA